MKKILCIILSIIVILSLSACAKEPIEKLAPHGLPLSFESTADLIENVEWFHQTPKARMATSDANDYERYKLDKITKLYEYEHLPEGATLVDDNLLSKKIELNQSIMGYRYRLNRSDIYQYDSLRFSVIHMFSGKEAHDGALTPDWIPFEGYEDVYFMSVLDKTTGEEAGRQYKFFYDNHTMGLYLPNAVFDELEEAGVDIFSAKVIYERNTNN